MFIENTNTTLMLDLSAVLRLGIDKNLFMPLTINKQIVYFIIYRYRFRAAHDNHHIPKQN